MTCTAQLETHKGICTRLLYTISRLQHQPMWDGMLGQPPGRVWKVRTMQSAMPNGRNCLLFKWASTAFLFCTADLTSVVSHFLFSTIPANTIHWPNAGLMLARRLRRRPNINPALDQCIVLAGMWSWTMVIYRLFCRRGFWDYVISLAGWLSGTNYLITDVIIVVLICCDTLIKALFSLSLAWSWWWAYCKWQW